MTYTNRNRAFWGRLLPASLLALLILCSLQTARAVSLKSKAPSPLTLWYMQPAAAGMNEALPIGNGRMGALLYGGAADEKIIFNESSLWTGDKNPGGDYGKMGSYQKFGEIDFDQPAIYFATQYRRDLDLDNSTAHVRFVANGVTYQREYFASNPAQVIVARYTADHPGAYTGTLSLLGAHEEKTAVSDTHRMTFSGKLSNGIAYEAQAQIIIDGGTSKIDGSTITLDRSDSVTVILGAATSYVLDSARNYLGSDPHPAVTQYVDAASRSPYDTLRRQHIADYEALFHRVNLNLGRTSSDRRALPTDARKILAGQGDDPELEQLLYQYGRYLLVSCSRPGSLPSNLQGIWNDSNTPPWSSDYHTDLNIQMDYWPVEAANLSECAMPLFDLIDSQIPSWRQLTQADPEYKLASGAQPTLGWDTRASFNITGGMGWLWIKTSNAWLLQSYWEHYAFTGDKNFLRTRAYPLMKEICQFWDAEMKTLPDGRLVVPNGWSPEHGSFEDGVSFNQELVWDLFTNYIAASKALDIDPEYRARIVSLRDKLLTPKIGHWGQLQEWVEDKDDPNDHHRHTSHLIGVYPGHEFSVQDTPAMMDAAKVSLLHRGNIGDVTEWVYPWRAAQFARMRDGDSADRQLTQFFAARNSCVNLFGLLGDVTPPVMQIDGNFGITAAMSEMLLQSQHDGIDLLPALPSSWRAGSITGLRARGGFVIDESWRNGVLKSVTVHSAAGAAATLRYKMKSVELVLKPGQTIRLDESLKRL
jgi:alpha-L-fucosidase 2